MPMRAARLHELGGKPQVDEIDDVADGAEVACVPLNPVDIAIGAGGFYGGSPDPPFVIGSEAIGTLDGRRVWFRKLGTAAERVEVDAAAAVELPDGVDEDTAAACGIAGITGWLAVAWRTPVRE